MGQVMGRTRKAGTIVDSDERLEFVDEMLESSCKVR